MCFTVYCISIHPSPYAGTFSDLFYLLFKDNLFLSQLIVRKMSAAKSLPLLHCHECHRSNSWPFDRICKKKTKKNNVTDFVQIHWATCCSVLKNIHKQYWTKNRIRHTGCPWTHKVTHWLYAEPFRLPWLNSKSLDRKLILHIYLHVHPH